MYSIGKKIVAEALGTFVLVFFGCGTAVVTGCSIENPAAYLMTALAFGLSVMAMAYAVGKVSGGHFNPAVTIGFLVKGELEIIEGLIYMISQCMGAILAGGALYLILGVENGLGANALYNNDVKASLIIECILTFVFVFVILSITDGIINKQIAGLIIGLSLTLVHILGIAFTGTSVNPARSLGVAMYTGGPAIECLWVFLVAPLAGGVIAGIVYRLLIKLNTPVQDPIDTAGLEDTLTPGDKREAELGESFVEEEELVSAEEVKDVEEDAKEVVEKADETVEEAVEKATAITEEASKIAADIENGGVTAQETVKEAVKEEASKVEEAVQEKVAETKEKVADKVEEVKEKVEATEKVVEEKASEVVKDAAKETTKK